MPQRGLEGRLAISRRYTSGAKPAWNADFVPDVTRPENREVPQKGLEGKSEGLKLLFGRPGGQNITICAIFVKYEPNSTRCRQVRRRGGRRHHPGRARRRRGVPGAGHPRRRAPVRYGRSHSKQQLRPHYHMPPHRHPLLLANGPPLNVKYCCLL